MMLKTKSAHENTLRQMQKQQNNNFSRQNKSKQIKQVRKKTQPAPPQITSVASISSKRLHKPSRSTIEPNEHLHYNSPISIYHQNENIQSNTFSFTHILQQNLKNQQSQISIQTSIPLPVTSFQLKEPKSISIAITNRNQQRKSGISDEQMLKNVSMSRDKISIQKDYPFPKRSSVEKSVSRSPLRAVNLNKINNTPKIKQYKKEKDEQKSFKNLLQNKQNQQIRFQCSQKIFKFIENINIEGKSLSKKDIINGEKSKSNLLSTGIINLSQRLDHDKLPSQLIKTSKCNILNKSMAQSSNQQIKQFFEQDSSPYSQVFYQDQIKQLKQKICKTNHEILQSLSRNKQSKHFQALIANNNNPQRSQIKSNEIIQRLMNLKSLVIESVEDIVSCTARLSRSFIRDIDESIKNIDASCKTGIDWVAIQQSIIHYDDLESIKYQNDILMERINYVQGQVCDLTLLPEKVNNFTAQKAKIQAELKDINLKIPKLDIQYINKSLKYSLKSQLFTGYFEDIDQKIQKLRTIINDSQNIYK